MTLSARLVLALLLAASAPAAAQTDALAAARASGVVGERYDGYLGFAATASEAVRRQAGAINITRRSLYTSLATKRRVTVQEVGIAAGCSLLARVAVGEAYMLSDGTWRRRDVAAPAPVPSYCNR